MFTFRSGSVPAAFLAAALCLLSAGVRGQEEGGAPAPSPARGPSGAEAPPVEQALVPEGVFAMQLAEALKLGPADDAAKAEKLLSDAGIEPKSGWISDYPVTPEVIGDIEKNIGAAADQGKLAMSKDQALTVMAEVKSRLGLDVKPGAPGSVKPANTTIYSYTDRQGVVHYTDQLDSVPAEYRSDVKIIRTAPPQAPASGVAPIAPAYAETLNPEVINNYYYQEGPPAVTYYPPPEPYYYLYSWVPYPFWSTGFYFPGFFILRDFHRHVFFNRHPYFVTRHMNGGGFRRPIAVPPPGRTFPGNPAPRPQPAIPWFASPGAQSGARTILRLNQNRPAPIVRTPFPRMNPGVSLPPSNRWAGPMVNRPPIGNGTMRPFQGRTFNPPVFRPRPFAPAVPRVYSPPAYQQRNFAAPRFHGANPVGSWQRGGAFVPAHPAGGFGGRGGSFGGGRR